MYYSSSARWNALIIILLAILLVLGIIYAAQSFTGNGPYVPQSFTTTRAQAAQTSSEIVSQAATSITNLNAISAAYNAGNYSNALDLAIQETNRNNEERASATILATELGSMANDLYQVRPDTAEQAGVQAIGEEYQILSNLLNYTAETTQLLDDLKMAYVEGTATASSTAPLNARLDGVVAQLNADSQSVNSLNQQYLSDMAQFDTLTK